MDAFGFYTVPEDKRLNLVDFLTVNLLGVCQTLCPEKMPAVVVTHDSLTPDDTPALIRYTPALNIFTLHSEAIAEQFGSLLDDLTALFTYRSVGSGIP